MADLGLSQKRVLVTGASRGIGLGIAKAFADAGARVALLAETDDVIAAASGIGTAHVCDLTAPTAIAALDTGPLDILINNAGLEFETRLDDPQSAATVDHMLMLNVAGMFRLTQKVLPDLVDGGAIVNTASVWGRSAPAGFSGYAASKHGVIGLTRAWSRELSARSIRVNAVCPGWVGTDAALRSLHVMAERRGVPPATIQAEIEGTQDIPGFMTPADVASLYLFLASPLASNITGQAINVDRGELQV
ncbi:MAG: SDR family oxidoreductase [Pseudomonadota bacterium]